MTKFTALLVILAAAASIYSVVSEQLFEFALTCISLSIIFGLIAWLKPSIVGEDNIQSSGFVSASSAVIAVSALSLLHFGYVEPESAPPSPIPEPREQSPFTLQEVNALLEGLGFSSLIERDGKIIVSSVVNNSEAHYKGVRSGDHVAEASSIPVQTVRELEDRVLEVKERGRRSILLLIRRDTRPFFAALEFQ